ncbi:SGNH/GDSL hydrolase family protein [Patescibacteria group bacterium]|nr:SGNH/GDSL hydrolase family protein [Patescibacteria group bacterium]
MIKTSIKTIKNVFPIKILILLEIIIIAYLTIRIIENPFNLSVNVVPKNAILISQKDGLKYFFEPNPDYVEKIKENWLPKPVEYTINHDTLNERFNYQIKKPINTYRIITLGDSFTFGENVPTAKNWTELLEDDLNKNFHCKNVSKFEVINLGVYAYDMQYEVERYKIRGIKYNPDLVIWTLTDFERILELEMPYIKAHNAQAVALEKKGIYYKNWQDARIQLKNKIGEKGFIDFTNRQLNNLTKLYKNRLLIITLPNDQSYIDLIKTFSKENSKTSYFQPAIDWGQKQYFYPDNHFNELGNQKMEALILGYLKNSKVIPCN